jgi:HK97 family phage major capsid protein
MRNIARKLETKSASENPVDEVKTALAALSTAVEEVKAKAVNDNKLADRIAEIETKLARPAIIGRAANDNEPSLERKAFTSFLRHGPERMALEDTKALVVSDDTRGGYLAPAEFQTEILKNLVEISPVRQAARVGSTSAPSVILPARTGTPTANWVGEVETRTETGSTYGQVEIPVHEMAAYVDVSVQLLEDAAVNVESEVASDLAQEFGRLEGVSFVSGNGFKKPLGFMTAGQGIVEVITGSAATIADSDGQANALIAALYDLPQQYRSRAVFMMNGTTLGNVRKLKTVDKQYLWQPGIQAGEPGTLLGRPVIEAPDMPDEGAGAFPIILGDFDAAYRIYDRVAMSMLRDPYTQATTGKVRFHARRRVGGGLVKAEALRKIKCATS